MIENDVWLPWIDLHICSGCGDCVAVCPVEALALVDSKAVLREPEKCTYCSICETICPAGAIALPYQIILKADR